MALFLGILIPQGKKWSYMSRDYIALDREGIQASPLQCSVLI